MTSMLFFSIFSMSQSLPDYTLSRNYLAQKTYLDTTKLADGARSISNVTYVDGFGRPLQEILLSAAADGISDLLMPHLYEAQGVVEKNYLPYAKKNNRGAFDTNMYSEANWTVYGEDDESYAYSLTDYERSPLSRRLKITGPGKAWHTNEKGVSLSYGLNDLSTVCKYRVTKDGMLLLDGFYAAGSLRKTVLTDEDGHKSIVYTDTDEKEILILETDGSESHETYFVYDDRKQLRWVLPPRVDSSLEKPVLDKCAYYYEYDALKRMTLKKLPGCDPIYMVYDHRDRLVMIQDGNQRNDHSEKWGYCIYDIHNRLVEQGEIILSTPHSLRELQAEAWDVDNYLPKGVKTPLQYTRYDYYSATSTIAPHPFMPLASYESDYYPHVASKKTSVKSRVLGTNQWIVRTLYYDAYGRVIQEISNDLSGGLRVVNMKNSFKGDLLKQKELYILPSGETDVGSESINTYDDRSRLLTTVIKLNDKEMNVITYEYDDIGRLVKRKCGQLTESLDYNIRGWLTGIENSKFAQSLHYTDGTGAPYYSGNVSSMIWKAGDETDVRGYEFTYDGFSRLLSGTYGEGNDLVQNKNRFNEEVTGYDEQGNILGLKRYGQLDSNSYGLIDDLLLTYTGNQLCKVTDCTNGLMNEDAFEFKDGVDADIEYFYDRNGNLIKDLNKKIAEVKYNCLNLPSQVLFEDGNSISYVYDASGTKLRTTHIIGYDTTVTDYCGSAIYENGIATKLLVTSGYITLADELYHYFLQDYQGNNRVVINQNGDVEEVNHYYPFGGVFASTANTQHYKYNGKELDAKNGLNWYDYGARMYDATLGRWHVVDPSAEKYYSWSPYVYVSDNPLKYIDPNGKEKIIALNRNDSKDASLIMGADKYKDDGAIHIWAHGTSESIFIYDQTTDSENIITTAVEFEAFLNANSEIWRTKEEGAQIMVILHSCETGKETNKNLNPIAREISGRLDNATIIAPSEKVVTNGENEEIGSHTTKRGEDGRLVKNEEGSWFVFAKGERVHSFPGSKLPGEGSPTQSSWNRIRSYILSFFE